MYTIHHIPFNIDTRARGIEGLARGIGALLSGSSAARSVVKMKSKRYVATH
jgi:hypothetical protein